MQGFFQHLFAFLMYLGGGGLFVLGILDSSFLFMPLGNDLLLTALTISHQERLPLYVLMAASGSCAGVSLLDAICRKGGEAGLKKMLSKRRFQYLKRKMSNKASLPIFIACLAPPPFPFTPVIATASAFNYPRRRLLGIVWIGRALRFSAIGLLAIVFGKQILWFVKTKVFLGFVCLLIVACVVGSTISLYRWIRQSRKAEVRANA
jgi:membrane protein DedA with SNARE-associated domain